MEKGINNTTKTRKQREKELRKKYRNRNRITSKVISEPVQQTTVPEITKPSITVMNKGKNFLMPQTDIIDYIFSNYQKYTYLKRQRESNREYPVTFDELFLFDINTIPNKLNLNLNTQIAQNPSFTLDKLIAYSIYTTSPFWFDDDISFFLTQFTNQIGKDLRRGDYIINGDNKYSRSLFQSLMISNDSTNILPKDEINEIDLPKFNEMEESDFKIIANYFYDILNKTASSNNVTNFNDNMNNKISLLSIQNINNFIFTNILGPWISNMISPEQAFIVGADVLSSDIVINLSQVSIEINMKCNLLFSNNGILDPEIPFGNLDAKLFFDILNNSYKFNSIKISYNLTSYLQTQPQTQAQSIVSSGQTQQLSNLRQSASAVMQNIGDTVSSNPKILYGTAAAGITGALIALPFLLGGKSKKNRRNKKNKNKTNKNLGKIKNR